MNKQEAIKNLEVLGNAKSGVNERTKAIIYLSQYIALSIEPMDLTTDDLDIMRAEVTD